MSYFDETSATGEKLIHSGKFHWYYDVIAFGWLFSMVGLAIVFTQFAAPFVQKNLPEGVNSNIVIAIIAFVIILNGLVRFLAMMVQRRSTEILITNRRLIFKRGIIARRIDEVQTDRIEGCIVYQGLIGRILGYGTVVVRGTGIGEIFLPPLQDPLSFRRAIDVAVGERNN